MENRKYSVQKEEPIITEEDRATNPIFNIVYKRIRNLQKKLNNINKLAEKNPKTLKPQQIQKRNSKDEVIAQIKKNEEFAVFYKNILLQNNGVAFDISDQLMKVSTLIAVGAHASKSKGKNNSEEVSQILTKHYKPIEKTKNSSEIPIVDKVVKIFGFLSAFLEKEEFYETCQDYITYLPNEGEQSSNPKTEVAKNERPSIKWKQDEIYNAKMQEKKKQNPEKNKNEVDEKRTEEKTRQNEPQEKKNVQRKKKKNKEESEEKNVMEMTPEMKRRRKKN